MHLPAENEVEINDSTETSIGSTDLDAKLDLVVYSMASRLFLRPRPTFNYIQARCVRQLSLCIFISDKNETYKHLDTGKWSRM